MMKLRILGNRRARLQSSLMMKRSITDRLWGRNQMKVSCRTKTMWNLTVVAICTGSNFFFNFTDMFPAKRKRGPGKSPIPFKKRKPSPGKGPPYDKKSFKPSDRGNKDGRKRFGDRKPLEGRNRFRKSEGGKRFGQKGGTGNRAGQKKGERKFGGQKTFRGRAVMKRQKGAGGKKDFKHKKGKS